MRPPPSLAGRGGGSADDPAAFLGRLPAGPRGIVAALREAIRRAAPGTDETLAWGSLSWHRPDVGGRVRGAVCQVTVKRGAVRLEFIHGVRLQDPGGLLQGNRLSKRYVPVASAADAARPAVAALLREAAALDLSLRH